MENIENQEKNIAFLDSLASWRSFWAYIKGKARHPGVQRHSRNIGWMFFAKVASMVISLIATFIIARHLGPTNYGQLSYALNFTSLFAFLASLGIDQVLYRDLIKYPEKRDVYMGTALRLKLVAAVITVFLCTLSAIIWSAKDISLFLIFLVSLTFVFTPFQLLGYEFQAEAKAKYPSIVSLLVTLILNALKIVVILFDKGVIYLALIVLLEPILYAIGYLYLRIKKYGAIQNWTFDRATAATMLKDSFPLIFSLAFFSVYSGIDQVMIKNMLSTESAGLYGSAVSISEAWYFIPNIIVGALFPVIVNAKKISESVYYERIKKLFLLLAFISIGTALPTAILSKYLIRVIFGASFLGAVGVLQIYVWSNVGAALNLLAEQVLVAENLTAIISLTTFLGMASNVLLNIYLIPRYGMPGAAYASLISYLVPFFSLLLFKNSKKIFLNIFRNNA